MTSRGMFSSRGEFWHGIRGLAGDALDLWTRMVHNLRAIRSVCAAR